MAVSEVFTVVAVRVDWAGEVTEEAEERAGGAGLRKFLLPSSMNVRADNQKPAR